MIGWRRVVRAVTAAPLGLVLVAGVASARDINYTGEEVTVYVKPGEATQIEFPSKIEGGFKTKNSALALERRDNYLVVFSRPEISVDGETIIVHLDDKRTYSLRLMPSSDEHPRDGTVKVNDSRDPDVETEEAPALTDDRPRRFAPPHAVSGLAREMILVAEFGKQKGIPGYRRSNRYSGETILEDGALQAKIDEIFMGSELWGYVVTVENRLSTTQRLNPATFRLDGTRAIVAQRWELAPRPETAEQQIARQHVAKIYIITRSKRR